MVSGVCFEHPRKNTGGHRVIAKARLVTCWWLLELTVGMWGFTLYYCLYFADYLTPLLFLYLLNFLLFPPGFLKLLGAHMLPSGFPKVFVRFSHPWYLLHGFLFLYWKTQAHPSTHSVSTSFTYTLWVCVGQDTVKGTDCSHLHGLWCSSAVKRNAVITYFVPWAERRAA